MVTILMRKVSHRCDKVEGIFLTISLLLYFLRGEPWKFEGMLPSIFLINFSVDDLQRRNCTLKHNYTSLLHDPMQSNSNIITIQFNFFLLNIKYFLIIYFLMIFSASLKWFTVPLVVHSWVVKLWEIARANNKSHSHPLALKLQFTQFCRGRGQKTNVLGGVWEYLEDVSMINYDKVFLYGCVKILIANFIYGIWDSNL